MLGANVLIGYIAGAKCLHCPNTEHIREVISGHVVQVAWGVAVGEGVRLLVVRCHRLCVQHAWLQLACFPSDWLLQEC